MLLLSGLSPVAQPAQAAPTTWSDVSESHWAYPTLKQLAEKYGVSFAYPDGSFQGQRQPTRFEVTVMLLKTLEALQPKAEPHDQQALVQLRTQLQAELESFEERLQALEDQADLQGASQQGLMENLEQLREQLPFRWFGSLALRHCGMMDAQGNINGNNFQLRLGAGIRGQFDDWDYELRFLSAAPQNFNLSWWPFNDEPRVLRSPFNLDRYKIGWHPLRADGWQPDLRINVGKALNFLPETQLLYDEDASFSGLQQVLSWQPHPNWKELSLGLSQSAVMIEGPFIQTSLLAGKLASEWQWGDFKLRTAFSYNHYLGSNALAPLNLNQGYQGIVSQRNRISNNSFDSRFELLDGFAQLAWQPENLPRLALFGDLVQNLGASDRNRGWLAGVSVGQLQKPGDWELGYNYRHLEQDYNLSLMVDDFFSGTDVAGHTLHAGVQLAEKTSFSVSWIVRNSLSQPQNPSLNIVYTTLRQDF